MFSPNSWASDNGYLRIPLCNTIKQLHWLKKLSGPDDFIPWILFASKKPRKKALCDTQVHDTCQHSLHELKE